MNRTLALVQAAVGVVLAAVACGVAGLMVRLFVWCAGL